MGKLIDAKERFNKRWKPLIELKEEDVIDENKYIEMMRTYAEQYNTSIKEEFQKNIEAHRKFINSIIGKQ